MSKIVDFKCTYDNAVGISEEITKSLGLHFPDAYCHFDTMAEIALAVRKQENVSFCALPFCHTVEAEAMGGLVNLGDGVIGPRAKDYICTTMDEVLDLPRINYEKGRIYEVLKACRYLHEMGETVALMMSGPFTILNVLMDAKYVFKAMRKEPVKMQQVLDKFREELIRFTKKALEYQVDIISYADSSGGVNIIGPQRMEYIVEHFTVPFLKEARELTKEKAVIFCCPKTVLALIGTDRAGWQDIPIDRPMSYVDAVMSVRDKIAVAGQMCIKNTGYMVKNMVRGIELC